MIILSFCTMQRMSNISVSLLRSKLTGQREVNTPKMDLNIRLIAEDTGGTYGRTVSIDMETGVYKVKTIDKGEKEI